eukprot:2542616-Rhodomonas_salina.1
MGRMWNTTQTRMRSLATSSSPTAMMKRCPQHREPPDHERDVCLFLDTNAEGVFIPRRRRWSLPDASSLRRRGRGAVRQVLVGGGRVVDVGVCHERSPVHPCPAHAPRMSHCHSHACSVAADSPSALGGRSLW